MHYIPLVISIGILISWYFASTCITDYTCLLRNFIVNSSIIIKSVGFFTIASLLPSFIIIFTKGKIFKIWITFAAWWIPLSAVLIFFTEDSHNLVDPFSKDFVAFVMALLFGVISFILIAFKIFRKKSMK